MGIFKQFFSRSKEKEIKKQIDYKELSQYSAFPRYYNIQGEIFDIDSPESVLSIPLCKTEFNINNEIWSIDGILRTHVNKFFSRIPDNLKTACYSKISEYSYSEFETESPEEKIARIKQEEIEREKEKKLKSTENNDMLQFTKLPYNLNHPIIVDNGMALIHITTLENQEKLITDVLSLNQYLEESKSILSQIPKELTIKKEDISFKKDNLSFLECNPYTPTGKISKYPLVAHFKNVRQNNYAEEFLRAFWGEIYYMQDGSIGKASIICWYKNTGYFYNLKCVGKTLVLDKIKYTGKVDSKGLPSVIYKHSTTTK